MEVQGKHSDNYAGGLKKWSNQYIPRENKPMRILMVLASEFPPDERVEKEAYSLSEVGHKITIACYTRTNKPLFEQNDYYTVRRKPMSVFIFKSSAFQLLHPAYEKFWRKFIQDIYSLETFDAIHIHDLPLSRVGYYFKKKYGIKLVCDQHEYYSDWIVKTAHYNTFAGKIINAFSNWKAFEKKYLMRADTVITVEDPLKEIYIQEVGLPDEKLNILPNTPLKSLFFEKEIKEEIVRRYDKRFVLLYIGGLDRLRGLDLAMRAVRELRTEIPEILLLLIGRKSKYYDIDALANQYGIIDHYEWIPFQPVKVLPSYISAADICIFTPQVNREEIHRTIATKIYQYLAIGKPIVVTKAKLMQDFVESNRIGFAVDDTDPAEFVSKTLEIKGNPELKKEFASNAKLLSEKYFWEETVQPLIRIYQSP